MRRAALLRTLGLLCCFALALTAIVAPRVLALTPDQAAPAPDLLAAAALAVQLAGPLALIGLHGWVGGLLLAALAVQFLFWEAERARNSRISRRAPPPAPPRPYALPARVAVALQAAARARK